MAKKKLPPFDKYYHYIKAVQSPDIDCDFITSTYKSLRGKKPKILREDFCGTHAICCDWVKRNKENVAYGIDLDLEPIRYGQKHYASKLKPDQLERLHILNENVLSASTPKVDVINALNFSYYLFKNRTLLRHYFKSCRKNLKKDGLLILDSFGGSHCYERNEERTRISGGKFDYFWEQSGFDPITNETVFYIHFKRDGEKKRERVFKYDWRVWTIPEIREIMIEAGFRRTYVYWEGTTKRGYGDGIFRRREKGDECEAWIAYIVGEM